MAPKYQNWIHEKKKKKKLRAEKFGEMFAMVRMKFCPSRLIPTNIGHVHKFSFAGWFFFLMGS